jgi:hypothetical protein
MMDLLVIGVLKRQLSSTGALSSLVKSFNMLAARSILRTHIDSALRFSAAWFVESPSEFARFVLGGGSIRKYKDRNGKALTDSRLVELHHSKLSWLPEVYENLSGHIHFSMSHISAAVASTNEPDHTVSFEVAWVDTKYPESSWIELVHCFEEVSAVIERRLQEYITQKQSEGRPPTGGSNDHVS